MQPCGWSGWGGEGLYLRWFSISESPSRSFPSSIERYCLNPNFDIRQDPICPFGPIFMNTATEPLRWVSDRVSLWDRRCIPWEKTRFILVSWPSVTQTLSFFARIYTLCPTSWAHWGLLRAQIERSSGFIPPLGFCCGFSEVWENVERIKAGRNPAAGLWCLSLCVWPSGFDWMILEVVFDCERGGK